MRLTAGFLTLLLAFAPIQSSAQQSGPASLGLRGTISAKAMVSPSGQGLIIQNGSGLTARLVRASDERINIHLSGTPESSNPIISLRLLLRTNAAFELQSFLFSFSDAPSISASVASLQPTGPAVVGGAVEGIRSPQSQINLSGAPALLAAGPRISRGPATLSTNAVEIELRFEVTQVVASHWMADVAVVIYAR